MTAPLRWPLEAVWEAVAPLLPGFTAEMLPSVDSTNTELMRRARAGRCDPVLLVAEQQTAGRGRLGRAWHSQTEPLDAPQSPESTATSAKAPRRSRTRSAQA